MNTTSTDDAGSGQTRENRMQEALVLWLRWNDAYERITAELYEARHDAQKLDALMIDLDRLRQQAVDLSRQFLSNDSPIQGA